MLPAESAPLFYREVEKIATHPHWTPREQTLALAALLERIYFEATRREQLMFSTLFARISYAGQLFSIPADTLHSVHIFRRAAARVRSGQPPRHLDVQLGLKAVAETVLVLSQTAIPSEFSAWWTEVETLFPAEASGTIAFATAMRVTALSDVPEERCLLALDEENPTQPIHIRYGLPERNDYLNPTIQVIRKVFGFPVTLQLLEVETNAQGQYAPRAIVVEPDYLMDVSAVSECFKDTGQEPFSYLVRKFLPQESTEALLLGNIANFFLDRLLHEPGADWKELFKSTFQMYPFVYAPMTDSEVRSVSQKSQKHFLTLRQMAAGGFSKQGIEPENCVLEPTFFSEQYGLQGRLDLFYHTDENTAIVELKSGQPFKPNSYGIARSHFTQTLLYDLLVRSVFGPSIHPAKYILYSGVDLTPLRFAPTIAPEQWEALQVRNQLVALERMLAKIRPGDEYPTVLARLKASQAEGKGFLQRDFAQFEGIYSALPPLERKYFNAFTGFIAREHWMAKTGEEGVEAPGGMAALWRSSFEEKQQNFAILSHLDIAENRADQREPTIIFNKTANTNILANFRVGDIAVLYPAFDPTDTVLQHQVIKCTITALERQQVTVQLRYQQFNLKPFDTESLWHLESDLMDTNFTAMYRGLLEWAGSLGTLRSKIMATLPSTAPSPPDSLPGLRDEDQVRLTLEQNNLFQKMIHSRDYFLLWGPPGTGKTSVMLRALADWVLRETSDNLLLLAYTNRAVDEICEALDSIGGNIREQYLRIGSKFSTAERFKPQLLGTHIAHISNRAELRAILDSRRIFVSTVASFGQNEGLLRLKKFQRLVVDEASQILEPQIIGLLTRFEHFTLIGDHRQLPAVTTQRPEMTLVEDADLCAIGLTDLRDSYFERLYRRCEQEQWDWAYGRLSCQGRMHAQIMEFPNQRFYNGFLQILAGSTPKPEDYQLEPLGYTISGFHPEWERLFSNKRVVFFKTPPENTLPGQKTNAQEAVLATQLVVFFKQLWLANGFEWNARTLGIITPWRAQIARIKAELTAENLDAEELTVDTVERYQGGTRDIIILSCCVNAESQLANLVSLSAENIDRKLNVALTRARRHVIVLGNAAILQKDERYRDFITQYEELKN